MLPTTERLAQALEAKNDPNLAEMIVRARAGYYDDFKSPLTTPILTLVNDLIALGHRDLAARAKDGEFDATTEEGVAWWETEGRELFSRKVGL